MSGCYQDAVADGRRGERLLGQSATGPDALARGGSQATASKAWTTTIMLPSPRGSTIGVLQDPRKPPSPLGSAEPMALSNAFFPSGGAVPVS